MSQRPDDERTIEADREQARALVTPRHHETQDVIAGRLFMCLWVGEKPYTGKYHAARDEGHAYDPVHPDDAATVEFWRGFLSRAHEYARGLSVRTSDPVDPISGRQVAR